MLLRCGLSLRKVNLSCHLGLDILTPDNWLENVQNPAAVYLLKLLRVLQLLRINRRPTRSVRRC